MASIRSRPHKSAISNRVYGWTPSKPDFRDRKFASHVPFSALPPKIDLREARLGPPFSPAWDQGNIGSCGPFSAAKDVVYAGMKTEGRTSFPLPSRLFIYFATRSIMGTTQEDSGVDNRSLMKALAKHGWCDEELWPYDISKFKKTPSAAAIAQAKTRLIPEYLNVPQNLQEMKACIALLDGFIFGFTVYESFESSAVTRTGKVPMPKASEKDVGGHDIWFCGYSDDTQEFIFANSWGQNWGDGGFGYMPYAYATNPGMSNDFWTVRRSGIITPKPPDPPTPPPIEPGKIIIPKSVSVLCDDGVLFDGVLIRRGVTGVVGSVRSSAVIEEVDDERPLVVEDRTT